MSTILIVAVALAAPPADYESRGAPSDLEVRTAWREQVRDALRQQAVAAPDGQVAALEKLVKLARKLELDDQLSSHERGQLLDKLYRRIQRVSGQLHRELDRRARRIDRADAQAADARQPEQIAAIDRDRVILAQWQDFLGQFGGGAAAGQNLSNGDRLVEIIQQTIEPETWDINGGRGTIVIFRR